MAVPVCEITTGWPFDAKTGGFGGIHVMMGMSNQAMLINATRFIYASLEDKTNLYLCKGGTISDLEGRGDSGLFKTFVEANCLDAILNGRRTVSRQLDHGSLFFQQSLKDEFSGSDIGSQGNVVDIANS